MFSQDSRAAAADLRVRVANRIDDFADSRANQCMGAGGSATEVTTGVKRYIECRAFGARASLMQRCYFGVVRAGSAMPSASNDFAVLDDDATDPRVGIGRMAWAPRQLERHAHVGPVIRR